MKTLDEIKREINAITRISREEGLMSQEWKNEDADDILAIKFQEGGICPECHGTKVRQIGAWGLPCLNCNGTGVVEAETLGDIIKKETG